MDGRWPAALPQQTLVSGNTAALPSLLTSSKARTGVLGLAVVNPQGQFLAYAGPSDLLQALPHPLVEKSLRKGSEESAFGHSSSMQWLEETFPLHNGNELEGALVLVADASYIRSEGYDIWRRSFWRIVELVLLIAAVTFVMVRWFLMRPLTRVAERLRRLRSGHPDGPPDAGTREFSMFTPLAREVETLAESLVAARAAAEAEARLRVAGEQDVDGRAPRSPYARAIGFRPHFCGLESRALYARPKRPRDRVRSASQRPGHRD